RLDLTYFGYQGKQDLRLTPQIGVSLLATINALYGYAIPLLPEKQPFLTPHRVSIYLNFVNISKIGG
ncbi:MAG: hypothetical protein LPK19_15685, partial [Hymenobacteraceae bacterium]|nr:hypothetical protein [Hymenobacteraceae bacterium]MDX5397680.1 hypothetical protein [Hymenobacteraceae bacterium]MDX5513756.1 hypothetical protein [Hymenobacteraceae bacterium]